MLLSFPNLKISINNCGFFERDDLNDVSEESLYESMLEEFPNWLKEARKIGLITS